MFSKFFIDRPIFATVLAILMVLAGLMTVKTLPVAQFPDITPPTIMVSASYPGADAATIAKTVAEPIEEQVNGVEGMLYMSSSASDGSYQLTITFRNGTDIDNAAVDVQNRISMVNSQLPTAVTQQGVSIRKESSNNVLFVAITSDKPELYDALYLTNYAQINITDPLTRVKGVGGVGAFGGGEYDMRVWLDPVAMNARNITPQEVAAAISAQNIEVSAGSVGDAPGEGNAQFSYTLSSQGLLTSAEEFGNIIVRTDGNGILRLRDIARVELGSSSYDQVAKLNGQQCALIGVQQLPGANALEVVDGSLAELERLSKYFPDGIHYQIVENSADFVHESIDEVVVTFVETSLIVMVVILLFLQSWRAVVIPMITIPVSLIATFAVMKLLGFSLNTLTLFGLVLAIAIVVDDAIVVVEDCSRIVDKGLMNRKQAAIQAMKELTGPVVGEVLVLLSVFIPTAFVSGITGSLYKQFALTIAVSTAFSGFNALTLTPALCALFLTPKKPTKFFVYKGFNKIWTPFVNLYEKLMNGILKAPRIAMLVFLAAMGLAIYAFEKHPSSYLPEEDMGYYIAQVQLPTGASLDRTERVINTIADSMRAEIPEIQDIMTVAGASFAGGGSGSNSGSLMITLKPYKERKGFSVEDAIARSEEIAYSVQQEAEFFAMAPPSIPGLGMSGGLSIQLLDINNLGATDLANALDAVVDVAEKNPKFGRVTNMYEATVPQYTLKIDRDMASLRGLSPDDIFSAISAYMGGAYVDDFMAFGRIFQTTIRAEGDARQKVDGLYDLAVRNSSGDMVPLRSVMTVEETMGQPSVSRYNMYNTAGFSVTPAKGVSSSEAIAELEEIVDKTLGSNYSYAWTGIAYQETQSGTTISFVFIFAIIMTLLVLAAQYESWTDPMAVILAMPIAVAGCLVGVFFMNQSVSIYTQIGLILLLGMAAKNAILIVEYARDYRKAGQPILQAAHDAGVVRFRPIMMTALAFIFGVMPMLFATGAGAESRREIGTDIVFGMTLNAIIGTLMVPTFWYILQSFYEKHLSNILKFPNLRGKSSAAPPSGAPVGPSSPSKTTGADTSSDTSGTSDSAI